MKDMRETRLENIKTIIAERFEGNGAAFARAIERDPAYVGFILHPHEQRGRWIGEKLARDIEAKLKLKKTCLDKDDGVKEAIEVADQSVPPTGYVRLAHYQVEGSAGPGKEPIDFPEVLEVDVREQWVRTELRVSPERIRLLTARGDSMKGTIDDGDVVFVDVTVQQYSADGVYVFVLDGVLQIKRLENMMDGRLAVRSDNEKYGTKYVSANEADRLHVRGLVKGRWLFQRL